MGDMGDVLDTLAETGRADGCDEGVECPVCIGPCRLPDGLAGLAKRMGGAGRDAVHAFPGDMVTWSQVGGRTPGAVDYESREPYGGESSIAWWP